ncbi:MAG: oxidoreductase [Patescibacteria group bacterium]|nr:oxidoreductase [Patescibacteria group bacterium]
MIRAFIDPIDRVLNRVTMYKLVMYCLIGWLAIAALLAAGGRMPFSPLALLYSTAVILALSWLANRLFAVVFETHENVESVYITALILALIISPPHAASEYLSDLPLLVWAPILAMSSKFILAIGKKHLFNPAAIAVALTGLFIGASASWWVGTLFMLPFVAIGGLLIVRKIHRFDLVISFAAIALAAILFTAVSGMGLSGALKEVFIDSPFVFFATVMLTEPLTTPPTRARRIAYGAFVGALYAPAVHIGAIYSTPELALCIGNLLSYALSPKGKYVLRLVKAEKAAADTGEFAFEADRPVSFKPGQYMEWTLAHRKADSRGNRRYFTLANSPTEKHLLLGIKFYDKPSSFKKALAELDDGATIMAGQLAGDFTLPRDRRAKVAFLAGGIGITPFRSMIKHALDAGEKRDMVLVYSNKRMEEIAYADVLEEAYEKLGMKTVCTLTDAARVPAGWRGRTGYIGPETIEEEIPDYRERIFYISGPQSFVTSCEHLLTDMGVPRRRIKTDFFPGFA